MKMKLNYLSNCLFQEIPLQKNKRLRTSNVRIKKIYIDNTNANIILFL